MLSREPSTNFVYVDESANLRERKILEIKSDDSDTQWFTKLVFLDEKTMAKDYFNK